MANQNVLVLTVNGDLFGVEITQVEEILNWSALDIAGELALSPSRLVLPIMARYRNRPMPLVDLKAAFYGTVSSRNENSTVVVVQDAPNWPWDCLGLVVDEARDILSVPRRRLSRIPGALGARDTVCDWIVDDDETFIVGVNPSQILEKEHRDELREALLNAETSP